MIGRRYLIAGTFAGAVLAAGSALAQQATVGIQTVTTYSADARITAVDPAARTVSLAFTNGATATRNVSQAVADFGARKVGDMVSVGFEDRLTFVLSGPNVAPPRASVPPAGRQPPRLLVWAPPAFPPARRSPTGGSWASILPAAPSRWST